MKRSTCMLSAFVLLMVTYIPVRAEYGGVLQQNQGWTLNIDAAAINEATAVTVFYLGKKNDNIEIVTVPANSRVQLPFSDPGKGVRRIIVEVNPPSGQPIQGELVQNDSFSFTIVGDSRFVFDVE